MFTSSPEKNPDLETIKNQILEAYPEATDRLITNAIQACRQELAGDDDTGRLIRCVTERITA